MKKVCILLLIVIIGTVFYGSNINAIEKSENSKFNVIEDDYDYLTPEYYERVNNLLNKLENESLELTNLSQNNFTDRRVLNIPVYRQETDYYCGPATMQMAIKYLTGNTISQTTLANRAGHDSPNFYYLLDRNEKENTFSLSFSIDMGVQLMYPELLQNDRIIFTSVDMNDINKYPLFVGEVKDFYFDSQSFELYKK